MKKLRRSVKEAQQIVNQSSQNLESAWQELGTALHGSPKADRATLPASIKKHCQQVDALHKEFKTKQELIDRLEDSLDRQQEIEQQLSALPKELQALETSLAEASRETGLAALENLHIIPENPTVQSVISPARSALRKRDETKATIHQLEASSPGGLLTRTRLKVQVARLKTKLTLQEKSLQEAARQLGETLLRRNMIDQLADASLDSYAKQYARLAEKEQNIYSQQSSLENELQELEQQQTQLSTEKKPEKTLDQLRLDSHHLQNDLAAELVLIGKSFFQNKTKSENAPGNVTVLIKRISDITATISSQEKHIEQLEAAIAIKKRQEKKADLNKRLRNAEHIVARKQQDIARFKQELDETEQEIAQLDKIKGNLVTGA